MSANVTRDGAFRFVLARHRKELRDLCLEDFSLSNEEKNQVSNKRRQSSNTRKIVEIYELHKWPCFKGKRWTYRTRYYLENLYGLSFSAHINSRTTMNGSLRIVFKLFENFIRSIHTLYLRTHNRTQSTAPASIQRKLFLMRCAYFVQLFPFTWSESFVLLPKITNCTTKARPYLLTFGYQSIPFNFEKEIKDHSAVLFPKFDYFSDIG